VGVEIPLPNIEIKGNINYHTNMMKLHDILKVIFFQVPLSRTMKIKADFRAPQTVWTVWTQNLEADFRAPQTVWTVWTQILESQNKKKKFERKKIS